MKEYKSALISITLIVALFSGLYFFINSTYSEENLKKEGALLTDNFQACTSVKGYVDNLETLARQYVSGELDHKNFISELQSVVNYLTFARDMANGEVAISIDNFASELYKIKEEAQYDPSAFDRADYSALINSGSEIAKKCLSN